MFSSNEYDQIIDLLLEIPELHRGSARDALLSAVPGASSSLTRSENAATDLQLLVRGLRDMGQLTNGEWPLAHILRAARRYTLPDSTQRQHVDAILSRFEPSLQPSGTASPEVIVGSDERVSLDFFHQALNAANPVARLKIPRLENGQPTHLSAYGTGWLLAPQLLITNYHVIEARRFASERRHLSFAELETQARGLEAWFGFDTPDSAYSCYQSESLLEANADLDFCLLRLARIAQTSDRPLSDWGYLTCLQNWPELTQGERLNIIQHSQGLPKKLAIRDNFFMRSVPNHRIEYLTDTEPGASGSPVFDDSWRVVALHSAAVAVTGQIFKNEIIQFHNQGIKLSAILAALSPENRDLIASAQEW